MTFAPYKQAHLKQTTLIFSLEMQGPTGRPWNEHGDVYAVIRPLPRKLESVKKARELLAVGSWSYDFGDGWKAVITVRRANTKDVRKTRRETRGFNGCERMVASIILHGEIKIENQ